MRFIFFEVLNKTIPSFFHKNIASPLFREKQDRSKTVTDAFSRHQTSSEKTIGNKLRFVPNSAKDSTKSRQKIDTKDITFEDIHYLLTGGFVLNISKKRLLEMYQRFQEDSNEEEFFRMLQPQQQRWIERKLKGDATLKQASIPSKPILKPAYVRNRTKNSFEKAFDSFKNLIQEKDIEFGALVRPSEIKSMNALQSKSLDELEQLIATPERTNCSKDRIETTVKIAGDFLQMLQTEDPMYPFDEQPSFHYEAKKVDRDVFENAIGLQEIGKLVSYDLFSSKTGKLTDEQCKRMKLHPIWAASILKGHPEIQEMSESEQKLMLDVALFRHAGVGESSRCYPKSSTDQPFVAKIAQLITCFIGMTSPRGDRPGMNSPKALEVMKKGAGSEFDVELLHSFCKFVQCRLDC